MPLVHNLQQYKITADGTTAPFLIEAYQSITAIISSGVGAAGTVKLVHSLQKDQPDFTATADDTNKWGYLSSINLANTGTVIAGSAGYTVAGAACENVVAATDTSRWVAFEATGVAGEIIIDLITTD